MKTLTIGFVKEVGKKILAGERASKELITLTLETFSGTREEVIAGLAALCQSDASWTKKKGISLGFNNKALDGVPVVRAFRSARVILYSMLADDGHVLSTEEKEAAKKAASEKAASEKAAEKAAIVAETIKNVKELTPGIALNFLKESMTSLPLGTKERKDAEKAIITLENLFR